VKRRWDTGRTETFSDGVFAIAITLLVLDLALPKSEFHHLWLGIAHEWPGYLGYATSFLTIGGIWLAHHGIFGRLKYASSTVMRLNLLLLMVVAFLPFPTRLMAEAIRDKNAERAAVVFYGVSLFAATLLINALWSAILRDRELLKPEVSQREITEVTLMAAPHTALFLGAIALAIPFPKAAAFAYLVAAIAGVLRARGDEVEVSQQPAARGSPAASLGRVGEED
jgi:uncharacterized membrane protein